MKPVLIVTAATLISAASVAPAMAAWDRIGSVNVDYRSDRNVESFRFGGPVEKLQFRAERSDVRCNAIQVTFANGRTQKIYSGNLNENRDVNVDLPGQARNLSSLRFNCGAEDRRGATIRISADIGSYQNNWRKDAGWSAVWSNIFPWGNTPDRAARWDTLNNVRFQDTVVPFADSRGRNVEAVALMPLDTDARCSRVTVTFGNGRTTNLEVNRGNVMRRGQTYPLDLPGNDRNIRDIRLQCQSEGSRAVTMRVLARR